MGRRSTDLFDVFNAAASRRASREAKGGDRPRSSGPGLVLGRRQALLAVATVLLLVVLSFAIGVGVGRTKRGGGGASSGGPTLARVASKPWWFRGRLPRVGANGQDMAAVFPKELAARFPALAGLAALSAPDRDHLEIAVGPFETMEDAQRAHIQLSTWSVDGHWPFLHSGLEQGR
jgi:hypothetical protein